MDREKKDELPQMQVEFIDVICLPLYKVMSRYIYILFAICGYCICHLIPTSSEKRERFIFVKKKKTNSNLKHVLISCSAVYYKRLFTI